jgi:hypothetical protein
MTQFAQRPSNSSGWGRTGMTKIANLTKKVNHRIILSRMPDDVLETLAFSDAKAKLSDLMTEVVHGHRPWIVARHRGKEAMFLLGRAELSAMLESFRFDPKATVSEGEFVVRLPELGLIAGGETLDEALDELVALAEDYALDFFDRLDFYLQTDRRSQLPWLMRLAVTPPERRRALFAAAPSERAVLQPA